MDEIESMQAQIRALRFVVKDLMRDVALMNEFLRTKRPLDFRDFETWSEKQSAMWQEAERRTSEKVEQLADEILSDIGGERTR